MYLDQWFELTKVTIPLIESEEKQKKLTEKQKKVKNLIDKNATETKTFTGNTEEMKQIENLLNTREVLKKDFLTKTWNYLCDMEKASGCVKLYNQCLMGELIKIFKEENGKEASINFFGKSKSQLDKYVQLAGLLRDFPRLSVIGADFTLLVDNSAFIKKYIAEKNITLVRSHLMQKLQLKQNFKKEWYGSHLNEKHYFNLTKQQSCIPGRACSTLTWLSGSSTQSAAKVGEAKTT